MRKGAVLAAAFLAHALVTPPLSAKSEPPPQLDSEHQHPSGAFSFRTPESWKVETDPADPLSVAAAGDGVLVRFIYRPGDLGYDTFHADCMMKRLASPFDTSPEIRYEYDFLSGEVGGMRILDSAFIVNYDAPIDGVREWRQRNLTLTGAGHSLCAISYAPLKAWKKSKRTRELLESVLKSVVFRTP